MEVMGYDTHPERPGQPDDCGERPRRDRLRQTVWIALAIYLSPAFVAVILVGSIALVGDAVVRGLKAFTTLS
jgi:hypothetical protein